MLENDVSSIKYEIQELNKNLKHLINFLKEKEMKEEFKRSDLKFKENLKESLRRMNRRHFLLVLWMIFCLLVVPVLIAVLKK